MIMAIPVWLDCDPGHDDAMAIILAGYSPHLSLLGVSTVAGNQSLQKVTHNALDVLDAIGMQHIGVVAGQAKPIMRKALHCPEIHGESGLDGPKGGRLLPRSPRAPVQGVKAVEAMARALLGASQQSGGSGAAIRPRLVCTGSLGNAGLLLTLYPELIPCIEVVLMGGAMGLGNTGPVMEFNIQTDPEAARMVFESGVHLTMVPLEVTHTVLVTPDVHAAIGGASTATATAGSSSSTAQGASAAAGSAAASPFRHAIQELLMFFADTYRKVFKFEHPPLHDPCAVAYVIAPQLFEVEHLRVDIETTSTLSAGQTVCDVWRQSGQEPNCYVTTKVDVPAFWRLMIAAIEAADLRSPLNSS